MFLHFLNKNLQRAYFGPNLVLSTEDTMINTTNKQKKKQKRLPGALTLMQKKQ